MDVEKTQCWPDGDVPESYAIGMKYKDVSESARGYPDEARPTNFAMFVRKYRSWALSALISLSLVLLTWPGKLQTRAQVSSDSEPPRQSTNLTDVVQWDNYTLWLQGQRVFLQYEFPYDLTRTICSLYAQLGRVPHIPSTCARSMAGHLPEDGRGWVERSQVCVKLRHGTSYLQLIYAVSTYTVSSYRHQHD